MIGIGARVWALTRRDLCNPQLLVCASFAMISARSERQWSALLTAAAITPSLGWLLTCKLTIGAPLFVAYPSRQAAIGAVAFTALTAVLWPWWVQEWLQAV